MRGDKFYPLPNRTDLYIWPGSSPPYIEDEIGAVVRMPGNGQKYICWRASFDSSSEFQIRIDLEKDNDGNYITIRDAAIFLDEIKNKYPEDLELFLFHPEIFDGKYSK